MASGTRIGGYSPQQYHALFSPTKGRPQHWVATFKPDFSYLLALINRLAHFLLSGGTEFPNNAFLLERFGAHDFTRASKEERNAGEQLLKLFEQCDWEGPYLTKLSAVDQALKQPQQPLHHGGIGLGPNQTPRLVNGPNEQAEPQVPNDPGPGGIVHHGNLLSTPGLVPPQLSPVKRPPPPPAPGPAGGPPPPPPPPPAGTPPPPPPGGKATLPKPGTPTHTRFQGPLFQDEPKEPNFAPNLGKAALEALVKSDLKKQIQAIEIYLDAEKKIIGEIQEAIDEKKRLEEMIASEQGVVKSKKEKIDTSQSLLDSLGTGSDVLTTSIQIKADEVLPMPLLSNKAFDDLNAILVSRKADPLPARYKQEHYHDSLQDIVDQTTAELKEAEKSLAKYESQLNSLLASSNNGIPYADYERALAARSSFIEKWERGLRTRKSRLFEISKPSKPAVDPLPKKPSIGDLLQSDPEIVKKYPHIKHIGMLEANHYLQIMAKGRAEDFAMKIKTT
jgi:hypothetical protein